MPPSHLNPPGVLDLISQTGWVAKIVLLALISASILCWTIILSKWRVLQLAIRQNEKFIQMFWNAKGLDEIAMKCDHYPRSPIAVVLRNGIKELKKFSAVDPGHPTTPEKVENVYRALLRASSTEIAILEKYVGWLATTASAAPFVGLFGTVWGIMNSFQNIGASGAANLAVVAPGISEALITTATGIAAAIPAVIAYNYFAGQIKRIATDVECFSQDFINMIQRSFLTEKRGKSWHSAE